MKPILISIFVFCLWVSTYADYLKTSRKANLKEEPLSASGTLEQIEGDEVLRLLDEGVQTNGYYHVITSAGNSGWIYRTLVRRYVGEGSGSTTFEGTSSDVEVTVIDVGAGLSCLVKMPGNKFIIYDGGKDAAYKYLKNKLPSDAEIELLVLSHTDADHWGAVEEIVNNFQVKSVLRTDFRVNDFSQAYTNGLNAIESADGLDDYNLGSKGDIQPGKVLFNSGGVKLVALCGFQKPLSSWGTLTDSKANNAVSIVVRLEYKNHSILFGGDAVGRDDCDTNNDCIATEKFMLENDVQLLNSDVIVVPHHGADNASCQTFIEKVSPEYVIFSAGHAFRHPRQITAERYIQAGVDQDKIFRTDRGDHESSSGDECKVEWSVDDSGVTDKSGDDHVRIILPKAGKVKVAYLN